MFAALAMLKTIGDEYAAVTTFEKLKIYFVHVTDTKVHLWSMASVPEENIYELWLKKALEIKPELEDKVKAIRNFVYFCWKMKDYADSSGADLLYPMTGELTSLSVLGAFLYLPSPQASKK